MATINIKTVISSIHSAIDADAKSQTSWKESSALARQWHGGSLDTWLGDKKGIIEKVIVPALPVLQQKALERDLPRKGTKAHAEWVLQYSEHAFEKFMEEKISARAYADTTFKRVTQYAFAQELEEEKARKQAERKAESDSEDSEDSDEIDSGKLATNKAKLMADLSNWIKRLQKSEGEDFDINKTIESLQATIAILSK